MENASKALIFAASVLLAIMIMAFMMVIFRRFGTTARNTEERWAQEEIDKFNSKFNSYDTGGNHSLNDEIYVTKVATSSNSAENIKIKYSRLFGKSPGYSTDVYKKGLIAASQILNKGTDVVTAINDAIDINYKNNNGYSYNQLELQSTVEIIVDLGSLKNDFGFNKNFRYLVIEPNKKVKSKKVYGSNKIGANRVENAKLNIFKDSNEISVYDLLDEFRDTKTIQQDNSVYVIYKYYFIGETFVNVETGLIETVKFTLVKDENF